MILFMVILVMFRVFVVLFNEQRAEDYAFELAEKTIEKEGRESDWLIPLHIKKREDMPLINFIFIHRWTTRQMYPKLYALGE